MVRIFYLRLWVVVEDLFACGAESGRHDGRRDLYLFALNGSFPLENSRGEGLK
jgi:hypothetical protein